MSLGTAGAPAVRLREARLEDYQQISALTVKHGVDSRSFDEWRHVWVDNPEYRRKPDWPIGWIIEDVQGAVAGTLGNVPLAYEFEGKRLAAAAGRSWVVDDSYRGYAAILMDRYFRQKTVDLFINNTINENAEQAFAAFGSVRVPSGTWNRAGFWITNYRGFVEGALRAKGYPAILSIPAAAALFCGDALQRRPSRQRFEVQFANGFDQRFDVFWDRLKRAKPNVLLAVRDRETLAWHFHYRLLRNQVYILTVSEGRDIVAYTVFIRFDHDEFGLKRVALADYQSLKSDPAMFRAILMCMLRRCREQGIHMLEDLGLSLGCREARHVRELSSWLFCFKAAQPSLGAKLRDAAAWSPSLFDGDASL